MLEIPDDWKNFVQLGKFSIREHKNITFNIIKRKERIFFCYHLCCQKHGNELKFFYIEYVGLNLKQLKFLTKCMYIRVFS